MVPNGLAPNLVQDHIPTSIAPSCLCDMGKYGLNMMGNWVGRGLFKVEDRAVEQDCIPYGGQTELSNLPIKGQIIVPDVQGLLDDPLKLWTFLPTI